MGRKPQITKEIILEAALRMLIRDGYAAITVKTLADEIGCSTQPIVWHFDNMGGFRKAFFEYCIAYAKSQFTAFSNSLDTLLAETARGHISIACNTPHLFRFLFAGTQEDCSFAAVMQVLQLENRKNILQILCQEKDLNVQQATSFLMNYEFYIHGIASYTASGFCHYREDEIIAMANRAKDAFLAYEKQ